MSKNYCQQRITVYWLILFELEELSIKKNITLAERDSDAALP